MFPLSHNSAILSHSWTLFRYINLSTCLNLHDFYWSPLVDLSCIFIFANSYQVEEHVILVYPIIVERVYFLRFIQILQVECAILPLVNANVFILTDSTYKGINSGVVVTFSCVETQISVFALPECKNILLPILFDIGSSKPWSAQQRRVSS